MTKKTFTITLIVIIILALGAFAVWYFFFQPQAAAPAQNNSPFGPGSGNAQSLPSQSSQTVEENANSDVSVTSALTELSSVPVAGATSFTSAAGTTTVRYIERGTGHVFDVDMSSGAKTETTD